MSSTLLEGLISTAVISGFEIVVVLFCFVCFVVVVLILLFLVFMGGLSVWNEFIAIAVVSRLGSCRGRGVLFVGYHIRFFKVVILY